MVELIINSTNLEGEIYMCLGIPFKILEIHDKTALGEMNGARSNIRIDLLPQVKLGDYVMVHAGFGIEILKDVEAREALADIKEIQELEGSSSEVK